MYNGAVSYSTCYWLLLYRSGNQILHCHSAGMVHFFYFKATGCENLIRYYFIIIVPKSIILLPNLTKLTKKQRNLFEARVSSDVKDNCYEENLQYTKYQSVITF